MSPNTDRGARPRPGSGSRLRPETRRMSFIVEGRDPAGVAGAVRRVGAAVAPAVPVENLQTFDRGPPPRRSQRLRDHRRARRVRDGRAAARDHRPVRRRLVYGRRSGRRSSARAWRLARRRARSSAGRRGSHSCWLAIGLAARPGRRGLAVAAAMGSLLYGVSPADPATLSLVVIGADRRHAAGDGASGLARLAHRSGRRAPLGVAARSARSREHGDVRRTRRVRTCCN